MHEQPPDRGEGVETDRTGPAPTARDASAPALTCPNCGASLGARSCKLICPTPGCGYYLSCSDYY